jgi:hypothetical protein
MRSRPFRLLERQNVFVVQGRVCNTLLLNNTTEDISLQYVENSDFEKWHTKE